MTENERYEIRVKDKIQHEHKRSKMTENEKRKEQLKNKTKHQLRRSRMTENERYEIQLKDKIQHEHKRSKMTENEKRKEQLKNKTKHQLRRSRMTENERYEIQLKDKIQHEHKRSKMTENEKQYQQEKNNTQQHQKRSRMTENEKNKIQLRDKIQHQQKRSQMTKSNESLIFDFLNHIKEGPKFICTCCLRLLYRRTVIQVNRNNYKKVTCDTLTQCLSGKTSQGKEYICYTCHKKLLTGKLPPQAHYNNMSLEKIPDVLKRLCPLEVQLITKIIPFMKIVSLPKGAQHGLKGQVVLVPADLNRITLSFPRPSSQSQIIALA